MPELESEWELMTRSGCLKAEENLFGQINFQVVYFYRNLTFEILS